MSVLLTFSGHALEFRLINENGYTLVTLFVGIKGGTTPLLKISMFCVLSQSYQHF